MQHNEMHASRKKRRYGSSAAATAATATLLLAAATVASLLLAGRGSQSPAWWLSVDSTTPHLGVPADDSCRSWLAAERLPDDRCMAELQEAAFHCCSGVGYKCDACAEPALRALRCVSPRHMLMRPPPGCGAAALAPGLPPPPPPLAPGQERRSRTGTASTSTSVSSTCRLSPDALLGGTWVSANSTSWGATPGLPGALFQLPPGAGGSACSRRRPLLAAEVPRCLRRAGFDRVVISGDSTVRQLFNRLVSIVRQQSLVVDGGGMVHGHYSWQVWEDGSGGSGFATDSLWYSPTANHIQGTWNQSMMQAGLHRLLRLSSAAAGAGARSGHEMRTSGGGSIGGSGTAAGAHTGSSSAVGSSSGGGGGGRTALIVDFLVGSRADWQQRWVRQYTDSQLAGSGRGSGRGSEGAGAGQRTLLLLSLCIWEGTTTWPSGWLEFVEEMRQRVGRVVLLTCPTDRLNTPQHSRARGVAAERNRLLRQMVAEGLGGSGTGGMGGSGSGGSGGGGASGPKDGGRGEQAQQEGQAAAPGGAAKGSSSSSTGGGGGGGSTGGGGKGAGSRREGASPAMGADDASGGPPLMLLDVDALTQHLPQRVTIGPQDYHYQCYLSTNSKYLSGALEWAGGDGTPGLAYPTMRYDHLRVPLSGVCGDPVNFAAWQLLLSMLC